MSLIAVITDTHFGARNDNAQVFQNMLEFYDETFFPILKERGVSAILHGGDVFDRRKYLSTKLMQDAKDKIFCRMNEYPTHIICGNHDTPLRNSNYYNSFSILREFDNFKFYIDATDVTVKGTKFCLIPWITPENHDRTMEHIQGSDAKIALGHLELTGFEFHRGSVCKHGMSVTPFRKFDQVWSGHFHKESQDGNIKYLGSPYQTTWIEHTETKGFHIFDTDSGELEFIENPNRLFVEVTDDFDFNQVIKDKFLRVVVSEEKSKTKEFDLFKAKIDEEKPIDTAIKLVNRIEVSEDIDDIVTDDVVDSMDIIEISKNYIDSLENYDNKSDLKSLIEELYRESQCSK